MTCSKLCEKFNIGAKSYINGSKNCVRCDLYIITESTVCACCRNELIACNESAARQPEVKEQMQVAPTNKKSFSRIPSDRITGFKTEVTVI
jgi:hypothetical protein